MNELAFWNIVDAFDWDMAGDDDAVLEPAVRALVLLTEREICEFDDLLAEKLHSLDTREHCRYCYLGQLDPDSGDDYISADDFLYSRCVVVANGRTFFETVLHDPSQMPQDMEFESLLYLVGLAIERKTGREHTHIPPISIESFQNAEGWTPTEATKPGKYTGNSIPPGNRRPT